jgi:putative ABC transport system ATP-binding protein
MTTSLTTAAVVRAENAVKVFGAGDTAVTALDNVTLSIQRGQFMAIMGPSGSGKSTLMHCLAGLDQLTTGQAFIGELELSRLSDRQLTQLRRDRVGFVFQSFNLLPTLSALDNITLPMTLAGTAPDRDWVGEIIGTVGLSDRLSHRPAELSGGQQQRVAVARALANRPDIVFADEPTGNLDSRSGAEVLQFLRNAQEALHQTIVMVTHDPVAASYADTAVFLADGRLVGSLNRPTAPAVFDYLKILEG